VTVLAIFIVLTSKKCTYFGLAFLFYLIFSNDVRKRLEATNDLQFYSYFQKFRTTVHHAKSELLVLTAGA